MAQHLNGHSQSDDLLAIEETLFQRIRSGDHRAVCELIERHRALINGTIRRKGYSRGLEVSRSELIYEATVGLAKAMGKFEPDRNTIFCSYAKRWVEEAVEKYLQAQEQLQSRSKDTDSLNRPIIVNGHIIGELGDLVPDTHSPHPETIVFAKDTCREIKDYLSQIYIWLRKDSPISTRSRMIWMLRSGLKGREVPAVEVASVCRMSREAVRKTENRVWSWLKQEDESICKAKIRLMRQRLETLEDLA